MADCTAPPYDLVSTPSTLEGEDRSARLRILVRNNHELAWRLLRRLGVGLPILEDTVQKVFLIAASRIADIEPGKERSWVVGTVLRLAAEARRTERRRRNDLDSDPEMSPDPGPGPDALMDLKRARACLDQALDSLPEELRTVFVLFELEGMTGQDIASLLEMPPGTVASRLRRARALFRESVKKLGYGEGGHGRP